MLQFCFELLSALGWRTDIYLLSARKTRLPDKGEVIPLGKYTITAVNSKYSIEPTVVVLPFLPLLNFNNDVSYPCFNLTELFSKTCKRKALSAVTPTILRQQSKSLTL